MKSFVLALLPICKVPPGVVVPIPTFPVVVRVVNAPLLAAVLPMAPGEAQFTREFDRVPEVILLASRCGTSAAESTPHAGAAYVVPLPVLDRNILVVDVLPESRLSAPPVLANKISPRLVSGDKASNAALALVAPVPPLAMATVLVTLVVLPLSDPVMIPAEKLPEASRPTMRDAVLVEVALLAAFAPLPILNAVTPPTWETVGLGKVPERSPPALPVGARPDVQERFPAPSVLSA